MIYVVDGKKLMRLESQKQVFSLNKSFSYQVGMGLGNFIMWNLIIGNEDIECAPLGASSPDRGGATGEGARRHRWGQHKGELHVAAAAYGCPPPPSPPRVMARLSLFEWSSWAELRVWKSWAKPLAFTTNLREDNGEREMGLRGQENMRRGW